MDDTLLDQAAQAHLAVVQASEFCDKLRAERRDAVKAAYAAGHSMRTIGGAVGLSAPRVQRVIQGNRPKRRQVVAPPPVDL